MSGTDDLIAQALHAPAPWPDGMDADSVVVQATYHGVTAVLISRAAHLVGWPEGVRARLKAEALAQTMWEIRHRSVLIPLLTALEAVGIKSVILKGTALAYGLYPEPAQRARGDTDLVVLPDDLDPARAILSAQGFVCNIPMVQDGHAPVRQEGWTFIAPDGGRHDIDLHAEASSSPALIPVIGGSWAHENAVPLRGLSPDAQSLPLPLALLHACLHRAKHVVSPYSVAGQWHYGGDRLIWLVDIDLILRAMTEGDVEAFQKAATTGGVGPICAAALRSAQMLLHSPCPENLVETLAAAPAGPAARYLDQSSALGRVVEDLRAIDGLRGKLRHATLRLLPPAKVLRAQYPELAQAPILRLHLRRISGILRRRTKGST